MLYRRGMGRNAAEVVDEGHFDFIWNILVPFGKRNTLKENLLKLVDTS